MLGGVAVRAVVFDLFDTLVDLLWENLPLEDYKGTPVPATTHALHEAVAERSAIDFETFADALVAGARAFGKSHFAVDREVTTLERFEDLARRLAIEDPELPVVLTDIHMGILRREVQVPGHHAEVLGGLARDLRLGLCSNFSHSETALDILDEHGIELGRRNVELHHQAMEIGVGQLPEGPVEKQRHGTGDR